MPPNIEATRQLHQQIAELFGHNLTSNKPITVTNAQYANLVEVQLAAKPALSKDNAHLFVPPFFDCSHVASIDKVDVTSDIQDNKPALIYQIKWTDKPCGGEKKVSSDPEKGITKKRIPVRQCFSSNSSTSSTSEVSSESDSEPVPLVKKTSSMMKISGRVCCDGPCGKIVEQSQTVQFGCDHVICDGCRKKTTCAALFDGSPGCCNESCIKMAQDCGEKLCAGQSESKVSICSQIGAAETILTHICILTTFHRDVLRTQMEYEYPSSSRVQTIIKSLAHYKDLIANSRFYYCKKKPTHRSELRLISLTDTNLRFYDIVDMKTSPVLYFVIVSRDIQFFETH